MAETNRPGDKAVDADLDDLLEDDDDVEETPSRNGRTREKAGSTKGALEKGAGTKAVRKDRDEGGPGIFGRFARFVREIASELRKVIWPTRKELLTYTAVVIVFVAVVLTVVGVLDYAFAKAMLFVFGGAPK